MSKLSIITINYNNVIGLQKTMQSVLAQRSDDFEYIVVDGGSTDTSCQVIGDLVFSGKRLEISGQTKLRGVNVVCVSEKDSGIYNAMNKGIRMAKGEYIQFLNSGDILAANNVTEKMLDSLPSDCNIFYGNMLKPLVKRIYRDRGFAGRTPTMLDFYTGTLNHSSTYIKRSLFDTYGLYDENLKIVSDWKWYLQVIVLQGVMPVYKDIDVTIFDMNGISTVNPCLDKAERKQILSEMLPANVLVDYEHWASTIEHIKRINQYGLTRKVFWLVERILFKIDKWRIKYYR